MVWVFFVIGGKKVECTEFGGYPPVSSKRFGGKIWAHDQGWRKNWGVLEEGCNDLEEGCRTHLGRATWHPPSSKIWKQLWSMTLCLYYWRSPMSRNAFTGAFRLISNCKHALYGPGLNVIVQILEEICKTTNAQMLGDGSKSTLMFIASYWLDHSI